MVNSALAERKAEPGGRASERAMSALYREQIGPLRAYLARILRSAVDAEDVAQDAFVRLWRSPLFESFNHPRAVLFKTGYRLALNRLRQRARNPVDRARGTCDELVGGIVASVEETVIAREHETAFSHALEQLSPRRRQVIELRTVHELSYKEISHTLGLSISTLEKHLARGKSECTAVLAEWWKTGQNLAKRMPATAVAAAA